MVIVRFITRILVLQIIMFLGLTVSEAEDCKDSNKNCFFIDDIVLENSTDLSSRAEKQLLRPYLFRCISFNDINELIKEIANKYIELGYISARVKISLGQDMTSGKLVLGVVKGCIEDILMDKNSFRDKTQIFTAFPFLKGNPLNIRELDQGIEQMNRLSSNNASIKILPADDTKDSKILILNSRSDRLKADSSIDNLGEKSYGEIRRKAGLSFDNLLGINDNIYYSSIESNYSNKDRKFNKSDTWSFSFPFGYWNFSGTYNASKYIMYVQGLEREFKSSGTDYSKTFKVQRVMRRSLEDKTKISSSLTLKGTDSFIEDVRVDVSSRKLSILNIGVDHRTFFMKGPVSCELSYSKGLDAFDSRKDLDNIKEDEPKAQFDKFELNLNWNQPFRLYEQGLTYSFYLNSQYSLDPLFSSEKISIGGFSSIRGFKGKSISGDSGFYTRNEISWTPPLEDIFLKKFSLFCALDYGYVAEKSGREANYGRGAGSLLGGAAGLRYYGDILNIDFTYSKAINTPSFMEKDKDAVFFSLNFDLTNLFNITKQSMIRKESLPIDKDEPEQDIEMKSETNEKIESEKVLEPVSLDLKKDGLNIRVIKKGEQNIGILKIKYHEYAGVIGAWAKTSIEKIEKLNGIKFDDIQEFLKVGHELKIPLDKVSKEEFEKKRFAFHKKIDKNFWKDHKLIDFIVYKVKEGEFFWETYVEKFAHIPFSLIERYNREKDWASIKKDELILIPVVE